MRAAVLMVVVGCAALTAQPQQPQPPPVERPAQIQGRIVAAETGQPLVRARVALLSACLLYTSPSPRDS